MKSYLVSITLAVEADSAGAAVLYVSARKPWASLVSEVNPSYLSVSVSDSDDAEPEASE